MALYAVCSDKIVPLPGATVSRRTTPEYGHWSAWLPARGATRDGESRQYSMGPTAPRRFERGQTVGWCLRQHFFWHRDLLRQVPCSYHSQQCVRPHGQGDMAIPACPTPDLIVIQAHVAFGRFNTALDRPARASDLDGFCQGGGQWRKDDKGRQSRRITETAPDQQPAAPRWLHGSGQGQPTPIIPAGAFRPGSGTVPLPALRGEAG